MTVESTNSLMEVPPEDPAITQAFADLDEKLDAWSTAMQDAVTTLLAAPPQGLGDTRPPVDGQDDGPRPDAACDEPPHVEAETYSRADAGGSSEAGQTTEACEDPDQHDELSTGVVEPQAETQPGTKDLLGRPLKARTVAPPKDEPAHPPEQSEDDLILAALDPETAQAIRVMRRMSPVKRSARELLEEYKAAQQQPGSQKSKKKSWFSRG
jgi:hypothetical protein